MERERLGPFLASARDRGVTDRGFPARGRPPPPIRDNHVHDEDKPDTTTPDAIRSSLLPAKGILRIGVDASGIVGSLVRHNIRIGVAIVSCCAVARGGPVDGSVDPTVAPGSRRSS
jgi:hypothetical protein